MPSGRRTLVAHLGRKREVSVVLVRPSDQDAPVVDREGDERVGLSPVVRSQEQVSNTHKITKRKHDQREDEPVGNSGELHGARDALVDSLEVDSGPQRPVVLVVGTAYEGSCADVRLCV